jgi:hypothetical protein
LPCVAGQLLHEICDLVDEHDIHVFKKGTVIAELRDYRIDHLDHTSRAAQHMIMPTISHITLRPTNLVG